MRERRATGVAGFLMEDLTLLALEITDDIRRSAEAVSAKWKAPADLHGNDHLLRHIVKRWGPKSGPEHYFTGGRNDAGKVRLVIERLKIEKTPLRILDFAAGYGRVVRHIKGILPQHEVFASDIHPEACDFMSGLGVPSFLSATDPAQLSIGRDYDFIYVMSLFSHLPDKTFGAWLAALYDILAPGGHLLFTAHGVATLERFPEFYGPMFDPVKGYGYRKDSDQLDLDTDDYGSMVVSMRYVLDVLDTYVPEGRLRGFQSGAWFGGQDEWIIRKPS